jgi:hypothetical protein
VVGPDARSRPAQALPVLEITPTGVVVREMVEELDLRAAGEDRARLRLADDWKPIAASGVRLADARA